MAAPKKYPDELRARAVRLYRESEPKPVIRRLAEQLGVHHEALRNWIPTSEGAFWLAAMRERSRIGSWVGNARIAVTPIWCLALGIRGVVARCSRRAVISSFRSRLDLYGFPVLESVGR